MLARVAVARSISANVSDLDSRSYALERLTGGLFECLNADYYDA